MANLLCLLVPKIETKSVGVKLRTSQLLTSCEVFSARRNRAVKESKYNHK